MMQRVIVKESSGGTSLRIASGGKSGWRCSFCLSVWMALCLAPLVGGCRPQGSPPPPAETASTAPSDKTAAPSQKPDDVSVTVIDGLKRQVMIPRRPRRVVSIAPKNTEMLFALGLGETVVGVTTYCTYPLEAKTREKVGGFTARSLSLEKIVALKPDLVVAAGEIHNPVIAGLERVEIPVLSMGAESFEELYAEFETLGQVMRCEGRAAELIRGMQGRVQKVKDVAATIPEAERVSVFYLAWDDPLGGAGPTSYAGQLITLCGGKNILEDVTAKYPQVSSEIVLARDPEVILAPVMASVPVTVEGLSKKPGWSKLRAIRSGRVYVMDGDLISRCGPRLVEALEVVAHAIDPQRYPAPPRRETEETPGETASP